MKCVNHPETEAVAICIHCLNPFCPECIIKVGDKNYCKSCVSKALKASGEIKQKRSVKLTIGGILGIIAGVLGFFVGISFIADGVDKEFWYESTNWTEVGVGIAMLVAGIVAIVGSSYALARKYFGLALAGVTCGVVAFWLLGIPALLLIAFSKDDFDSQQEKSIEPKADSYKPDYYHPGDPFNRGGGNSTF